MVAGKEETASVAPLPNIKLPDGVCPPKLKEAEGAAPPSIDWSAILLSAESIADESTSVTAPEPKLYAKPPGASRFLRVSKYGAQT